jgi:hypothetical protein
MIEINVKEVLRARDQKAKPRPLIETTSSPEVNSQKEVSEPTEKVSEPKPPVIDDAHLASKYWGAFNAIKIERNKLSSQIHTMVARGATKSELKGHYQKIESYRPHLVEAFDLARFVERHGNIPEEKKVENRPVDLFSLKDERRKLIDKRCKLQKKIKEGKAKNPTRIAEWELELDQANAAHKLVDEKIKELEGRA